MLLSAVCPRAYGILFAVVISLFRTQPGTPQTLDKYLLNEKATTTWLQILPGFPN